MEDGQERDDGLEPLAKAPALHVGQILPGFTCDPMASTAAVVAALIAQRIVTTVGEAAEAVEKLQDAFLKAGDLPDDEAPPAPQVRKSITPDALISFVDNKPYKTLKRHLTRHGLTMDDYRARYGLPSDYPSVAPNYSAARSEMAKKMGLGAQRRGRAAAAE